MLRTAYQTIYPSCIKCDKPCDATPHQEGEEKKCRSCQIVQGRGGAGVTGQSIVSASIFGTIWGVDFAETIANEMLNNRAKMNNTPTTKQGEDSANFYQVGQMIECSNCHPEKYTLHQETCDCKCHAPTTQSWEEEFELKWGKCGAGLFEPAYPKDIASKERIKSFISQTLATAEAEWKAKLTTAISDYIAWNWRASLGYGKDREIISKACDDFDWLLKSAGITTEDILTLIKSTK